MKRKKLGLMKKISFFFSSKFFFSILSNFIYFLFFHFISEKNNLKNLCQAHFIKINKRLSSHFLPLYSTKIYNVIMKGIIRILYLQHFIDKTVFIDTSASAFAFVRYNGKMKQLAREKVKKKRFFSSLHTLYTNTCMDRYTHTHKHRKYRNRKEFDLFNQNENG